MTVIQCVCVYDYPVCHDENAVDGDLVVCTRRKDHQGDHVACSPSQHCIHTWPRIDPAAHLPLLFSQRSRLADVAVEWCKQRNADINPVNLVTALEALGVIDRNAAKSVTVPSMQCQCGHTAKVFGGNGDTYGCWCVMCEDDARVDGFNSPSAAIEAWSSEYGAES